MLSIGPGHGTETLEGSLLRVGDNGGLFLVSYSLEESCCCFSQDPTVK